MEHIERLACKVEQGDALTLDERRHAAAIIRHIVPPAELLLLAGNMLASSDSELRWRAEQLAMKLGCSGPYKCGYGVQQAPANDPAPTPEQR